MEEIFWPLSAKSLPREIHNPPAFAKLRVRYRRLRSTTSSSPVLAQCAYCCANWREHSGSGDIRFSMLLARCRPSRTCGWSVKSWASGGPTMRPEGYAWRVVVTTAVCALFYACAHSGVVKVGPDTYMIANSEWGFTSGGYQKAKAHRRRLEVLRKHRAGNPRAQFHPERRIVRQDTRSRSTVPLPTQGRS